MAGRDIRSGRYAVGGGDVQIGARIHRGLSQQGPVGPIPNANVPSEHIQRRTDMFGHIAEPVESDIRHKRDTNEYTKFVVRSESGESRQ